MNFSGFTSLLLREIHRFLRVIAQTIFTPMVNSTLYLLIFGVSIGQAVSLGGELTYLAFLIPGLVMMGVLNNSFQNSASSLMISKYHGDLEDLKVTPLSAHSIVWAISLASLLRGLIVGTSVVITGEIFYYLQVGEWLTIQRPLWALFFLVIGGISFAQIGIGVGFFARTFDHMNSFGAFIILPLIYLGGVFFSLDHLHPIWRTVSQSNPLLYYINGLRYAFIDYSDLPISLCAEVGLVFLVVCSLFAYMAVKRGAYHRF